MPRDNKINEKAQASGKTPEVFINDLIKEHGSIFQAAIAIGVYPNTLHHWLKKFAKSRTSAQPAQSE